MFKISKIFFNISKGKDLCPFCKSFNNKYIISQPDIRFFPKEVFHIYRCMSCNLLFTLPILSLEQINKYYPESYYTYSDLENFDELYKQSLLKNKKKYIRLIWLFERIHSISFYRELMYKFPKNLAYKLINSLIRLYYKFLAFFTFRYDRVFDLFRFVGVAKYPDPLPYSQKNIRYLHIGSGSINLFNKLRMKGFSVYNIDINKELSEEYKKKGINSFNGTIEKVKFPNKYFDLIYISHVFEHLLNPKEELIKLKCWLKDDGVIVCQFPLYGTIEWNSSDKYVFFDVPRHRIHIEEKNVKMIFDSCGLKILKRLNPPYGWGFTYTDFIHNYGKDNLISKVELSLKNFRKSLKLSFFKQSGNGWFYLRKER